MLRHQNIYLIGFRASGKTTLARHIAGKYKLKLLDTDHEIQNNAKMSISEMVAGHGWDYFRDFEKKIMAETALRRNLVVSTGGGVVISTANRQILKDKMHLTVYLKAEPALILSRLKNNPHPDQRPRLSLSSLEEEVVSTMASREPLYLECADMTLEADKEVKYLGETVTNRYLSLNADCNSH